MAKVGITVDRALGVSIPQLRRIARAHPGDHELAIDLWATEIHEARILASMVDDPGRVSRAQMEAWAADLDSWDVCDQLCNNLFRLTRHADAAARAWARRPEAFVKRTAFSLVATQAVHDRDRPDAYFIAWLPRVRLAATDERAPVTKAVSWALRQIGKRSPALREAALAESAALLGLESRDARRIAHDALRELSDDAVARRSGASPPGDDPSGVVGNGQR
jgi:3-methyladenine DNA glycosylase AlkD